MRNVNDFYKKLMEKLTGRKQESRCIMQVHVATDAGCYRMRNEDNYMVNGIIRESSSEKWTASTAERVFAAVFDGMGGEQKGDLASELSAQVLRQISKRIFSRRTAPEHLTKKMHHFTNKANQKIRFMLAANHCSRGGSTFAAIYADEDCFCTYSLGDSRIYLMRNGVLRQLTTDHTLAMLKYHAKLYTLEQAEESRESHMLTVFLGSDDRLEGLEPAVYPVEKMEMNDRFLLCSDGLYDMCTPEEITGILTAGQGNIAEKLVEKALANGGSDNATCIVITCLPKPEQ